MACSLHREPSVFVLILAITRGTSENTRHQDGAFLALTAKDGHLTLCKRPLSSKDNPHLSRLRIMAPSAPSPGRRVVVYYQTQYHNKNYVSPTPLIPVATHLIVAAFHLNKDKTIHLNNVPLDDPSLKDVGRCRAYARKRC